MISSSFLSYDQGVSRLARGAASVLLAVVALGVVGGCDAVNVSENASESSSDSFDKADLLYAPVSLGSGELFSIQLRDDQFEDAAASVVHEGTTNGGHRLRARFTPLQPSSVTVSCRNERTGTEKTMTTLTGDGLTAKSGTGAVATSDDDPDSFHYIDNGDNVVIEVDYDTEDSKRAAGAGFNFVSASQPVRCTHVSFSLEGVAADVSADEIAFGGDVAAPSIREQAYR